MTNCINYNNDIQNMILANLDGWRITDNATTDTVDESINPFMTSDEVKHKANKLITEQECMFFYEEALDLSLSYTNRLNIDDLNSVESRMFIRAVCKWAASNLWNKYNIRVNNEDMEDTYVQSYGGLLYHSAIRTLDSFINKRLSGLNTVNERLNNNPINPW